MISRRSVLALGSLTALTLGPLLAAVPAAAAPASSFWYVDALGLDQVHQTTRGEGVTIAVIDDGINLEQPEFAGSDVVAYPTSFCDLDPVAVGGANYGGAAHGTTVSLYVVGNGSGLNGAPSARGVAPGAELRFYGTDGDMGTDCTTGDMANVAAAVDQAIADGVDIISMSFHVDEAAQPPNNFAYDSLLKAQQAGIVVVASAPNDDSPIGFPATMNGIVTVESLEPDGTVNQPQTTGATLDIVAPGEQLVGLEVAEADPNPVWPVSATSAQGNSLATPIVASAIALSMSAWPEATSNQVLQALAATSKPLDGSPARQGARNDSWGYGALDLPALIATDPSQFPDVNPYVLADGQPAPAELQPTAIPTPSPSPSPTKSAEPTDKPSPTAEPTDQPSEEPEASPTSGAETDDGGIGTLPIILAGAGVLVAAAITAFVLRPKKKDA